MPFDDGHLRNIRGQTPFLHFNSIDYEFFLLYIGNSREKKGLTPSVDLLVLAIIVEPPSLSV